MNIVVCIKSILDERYLKYDDHSNNFTFEGAPTVVSEFDKGVIEQGVQLKEKYGGRVRVITVGPPSAMEAVRVALSMGCDEGYVLSDPSFDNADALLTSYLLSLTIRKIGEFDLILCGEASSDSYTGLVGPSLAEWMNLPHVSYVRRMSFDGDRVTLERLLEEEVEVWEGKLPLLVTAISEIAIPRVPTVLQSVAARKKPLQRFSAQSLGLEEADIANLPLGLEVVGTSPEAGPERKRIRISGSTREVVDQIIDVLRAERLMPE